MNTSENLYYTEDHEWLKYDETSKTAIVGITEFAQRELGDIVYVEIEESGDRLEKNEVFGTVEAVKTVSDLFIPVTSEILEVNDDLEEFPENVNNDPYGDGWMIRILVEKPDELELLMNKDEYTNLIKA